MPREWWRPSAKGPDHRSWRESSRWKFACCEVVSRRTLISNSYRAAWYLAVRALQQFCSCNRDSAGVLPRSTAANRKHWSGTHRALQKFQELANPGFLLLRHLALPAEQPGIEFGGKQGILKALDRPVENGDDHFNIHILAQIPALNAKAHKWNPSVRILGDEKSIDLALQRQIGAIVTEQINAIGNPVFAQHMFRANQPVIQDFKKSSGTHLSGHVQIF